MLASATSNHMVVDVTEVNNPKSGDEAVFIGTQGGEVVGAEALAARAGTSVYKILMSMNPLLPRIHVNAAVG